MQGAACACMPCWHRLMVPGPLLPPLLPDAQPAQRHISRAGAAALSRGPPVGRRQRRQQQRRGPPAPGAQRWGWRRRGWRRRGSRGGRRGCPWHPAGQASSRAAAVNGRAVGGSAVCVIVPRVSQQGMRWLAGWGACRRLVCWRPADGLRACLLRLGSRTGCRQDRLACVGLGSPVHISRQPEFQASRYN